MGKVGGKTNIDKIADAVMAELNEYEKLVADDGLRSAIDNTAKEAVDILHSTSPKRTGDYAKSWAIEKGSKDRGRYNVTVYAEAPEYRLTHLLEKGHAKVNGGRVRAIPHIADVEKSLPDLMEKYLREALT